MEEAGLVVVGFGAVSAAADAPCYARICQDFLSPSRAYEGPLQCPPFMREAIGLTVVVGAGAPAVPCWGGGGFGSAMTEGGERKFDSSR